MAVKTFETQAQELRPGKLSASLTQVWPMTGIVFWPSSERVAHLVVAGKQLEPSLKGLLPVATLHLQPQKQDPQPSFSIAYRRRVEGQFIQWETAPE